MKVEYNGQDLTPPTTTIDELQTMPTMTLRMRLPTAKELTLEVMPLVVERARLPFWRVFKRAKLTIEIERLVITALSLGYFRVNKHKEGKENGKAKT